MRLLPRAAVLLLLAVLAAISTSPVLARPAPFADDPASLARRVVELSNQERLRAGLTPLKWNDILAAAAASHAQDMAARDYFGHNSPEGTSPVERAGRAGYPAYGWGGLFVGENLARGYPTPEGAVQGWMASDGHRANLLNPKFREMGVAVAAAPSGARVWAQEFGSRPRVLPVFINGDAPSTDSPQVTLTVSAEDVSSWGSLGGITGMMVSNNADFAGASWQPYSSSLGWTLAGGSGLQRVYVRLRDGGGATTDSSDEIQFTGHQAFGVPQSHSGAEFQLGFKLLAIQIPQVVGDPLENEHPGENGDSIQRTSKGLMVWRKADNWTAFTNGGRSWVNGPYGVLERGNEERFLWER